MRRILFAVLLLLGTSSAPAAASMEVCRTDLDSLPAFIAANDAGGRDALAQWGEAHFAAALAQARGEADHADDSAACERVLNAYLGAWRRAHLTVREAAGPGSALTAPESMRAPSLRVLSARTVLIVVPNFAGPFRQPLANLLAQHRVALTTHPSWIVDVRGNPGGDDATFASLLPWLMSDGWIDVGASWLATPANIEAQEQACARVEPGDAACEQVMQQAIARMRGAAAGTFVPQRDGPGTRYVRLAKLEPHRPSQVAVLMDGGCGSSCEEFLLTVRQSFQVKLIGRRSAGSLDYGNLRPHTLPSGERVLWYATSRSNRLPGLPVDGTGVQPDRVLPEPASLSERDAEITQVERWLEGGSVP
jgi:hypothetical protein